MVTKRLTSNFESIFISKTQFFLKRSIWKYMIASIVLGLIQPLASLHFALSALCYFGIIMSILWPLQYISAKRMEKQIGFDANVEFSDERIVIKHLNKDEIESRDWSWIKQIESKPDIYWLELDQKPPFSVILSKAKMEPTEVEFFDKLISERF